MTSKILSTILIGVFSVMLVKAYTNIKITKATSVFLNDDYFDKNQTFMLLKRHNDSYNDVVGQWLVTKDLPEDTTMTIDIIRFKKGELKCGIVKTIVFKICDLNDENRKYLPTFLAKLTADGNCVKKGRYIFPDASNVKIEKLLPPSAIDGFKFKIHSNMTSSNEIIKIVEFKATPI